MTIYLVLLADKWREFWNVELYGTYESVSYAERVYTTRISLLEPDSSWGD